MKRKYNTNRSLLISLTDSYGDLICDDNMKIRKMTKEEVLHALANLRSRGEDIPADHQTPASITVPVSVVEDKAEYFVDSNLTEDSSNVNSHFDRQVRDREWLRPIEEGLVSNV